MGAVMVVLFFLIDLLFTAGYFAIAYFYGNYVATLEGGMFYFQLVLLCLALALVWGCFLFLSARYLRYATHTHNMFRKVDQYGLKSTSAFGIGTFAVLSVGAALFYFFCLLERENPIVRTATLVAVLAFTVVNYILFIWMWGRTQTYQWCPKCGRFFGKRYYVADEIGREAHEYKYKERERASTVENAQGQLVASVYNDVEKTGYTVRYFYRLRHHCRYCGDWEEQINIDKPTMFDGAWVEPYNTADVSEHINVTLTAPEKPKAEAPRAVPPREEPVRVSVPAREEQPLSYTDQDLIENVAIKQLSNKN